MRLRSLALFCVLLAGCGKDPSVDPVTKPVVLPAQSEIKTPERDSLPRFTLDKLFEPEKFSEEEMRSSLLYLKECCVPAADSLRSRQNAEDPKLGELLRKLPEMIAGELARPKLVERNSSNMIVMAMGSLTRVNVMNVSFERRVMDIKERQRPGVPADFSVDDLSHFELLGPDAVRDVSLKTRDRCLEMLVRLKHRKEMPLKSGEVRISWEVWEKPFAETARRIDSILAEYDHDDAEQLMLLARSFQSTIALGQEAQRQIDGPK